MQAKLFYATSALGIFPVFAVSKDFSFATTFLEAASFAAASDYLAIKN